MAENFKETKLEITDGHQVIYDIRVHCLAGKLFWQTVKDFDTNCPTLPTSWLLEIHLQQVSGDGRLCIPVTLKRNDSTNRPVNAYVTMRFSDVNGFNFFEDLISFGRRYVKPGEVIRENVVGLIRLPEKMMSFNEDLLVTVVIRIRSCHSGKNTLSLAIPVKKRKRCSIM